MKFRRILTGLLAVLMVACFMTACNSGTQEENTEAAEPMMAYITVIVPEEDEDGKPTDDTKTVVDNVQYSVSAGSTILQYLEEAAATEWDDGVVTLDTANSIIKLGDYDKTKEGYSGYFWNVKTVAPGKTDKDAVAAATTTKVETEGTKIIVELVKS